MDLETLFVEQRWNILKSLTENKLSPLQLSASSNTTIANISQQLRLLEAANLVKKEKIKNRDKGKPRTLFSLTNDYAYLVATMQNFAGKKLLVLDDFKKYMLRALFLKNKDTQYALMKFYWSIEPSLKDIDAILVSTDGQLNITIVSDKQLKLSSKFPIDYVSKSKLRKSKYSSFDVMYDPNGIFANGNNIQQEK